MFFNFAIKRLACYAERRRHSRQVAVILSDSLGDSCRLKVFESGALKTSLQVGCGNILNVSVCLEIAFFQYAAGTALSTMFLSCLTLPG